MSRLFETIRIVDRKLFNIHHHNARVNRSRRDLLDCTDTIDLGSLVDIPRDLPKGVHKCRIEYERGIERVEFMKYERRQVRTLTLVECDTIEYSYKFVDRSCIDDLLKGISTDDILIIKNGLVTDTSFANIIFYNGTRWITPSSPLLPGTARARHLDEHRLTEEEIRTSDLKHFKKAALINAMLDPDDVHSIDMQNII